MLKEKESTKKEREAKVREVGYVGILTIVISHIDGDR